MAGAGAGAAADLGLGREDSASRRQRAPGAAVRRVGAARAGAERRGEARRASGGGPCHVFPAVAAAAAREERKLKSHLYWKLVCLETIETAVPKVEEKEALQLEQRSVSLPSEPSLEPPSQQPLGKMRQLKGKPKKETSKDKKERKQAMQEARQQITTVVLPTLAVVVLLIVVFVYVATRPTVTE